MKPIVLNNVVERSGKSMVKPFVYSSSLDMNLQRNNTDKLFIEGGTSRATDSGRAVEDDLRELYTKTEQIRESDDDAVLFYAEMISKTFQDRERDDEDDSYYY